MFWTVELKKGSCFEGVRLKDIAMSMAIHYAERNAALPAIDYILAYRDKLPYGKEEKLLHFKAIWAFEDVLEELHELYLTEPERMEHDKHYQRLFGNNYIWIYTNPDRYKRLHEKGGCEAINGYPPETD